MTSDEQLRALAERLRRAGTNADDYIALTEAAVEGADAIGSLLDRLARAEKLVGAAAGYADALASTAEAAREHDRRVRSEEREACILAVAGSGPVGTGPRSEQIDAAIAAIRARTEP